MPRTPAQVRADLAPTPSCAAETAASETRRGPERRLEVAQRCGVARGHGGERVGRAHGHGPSMQIPAEVLIAHPPPSRGKPPPRRTSGRSAHGKGAKRAA
ncbi:hypothetical protein BE08_03415 [Sorangium cellulosum]|uniref:Uncharacterized protein n=1 Tax=Sorangium cellulosum TaxID=56 RepID=A0A150PPH3_SORCE|nr:hypothetical protein BE08_03415 [Sorangium cellulosum]